MASNEFKYATAGTTAVFLYDSSNDIVLSPTIAAGDFQISKLASGTWGTFANLATLPSLDNAATGQVKIDWSATEATAEAICIRWIDQAGAEWADGSIIIHLPIYTLEDTYNAVVAQKASLTAVTSTEFNYSQYIAGDTLKLQVDWFAEDSATELDLSSASAVSYIIATSPSGSALVTETLAGGGIAISVGDDGSTQNRTTVTHDGSSTGSLSGRYYQEIQVTDASGNKYSQRGYIIIYEDNIA